MIDLRRPIGELVADVKSGKFTAVQLVQASFDRIAETESFHTLLELNPVALERAAEIDRRIAAGETVGELAGIPYLAKDNFLTANTHTTAASHILEPFRAPYEAVAVKRLDDADAIMVAKANHDAFGHGASTENSDFGPSKNPYDDSRVPGGSSGGSAAGVALGQACFSIATDTGGSIRQPASLCGVVGLKVTYGLVPRTGVVAMASSTDTIGPIANSSADAALVLSIIAGKHESDATSIDRDPEGYNLAEKDLSGVRFGLIKEYLGDGINQQLKTKLLALIDQLKQRGATVDEVSLPATELALAAYYILVPAEISSNLARYDGVKYGFSDPTATTLEETYRLSRESGFGAEAKRRILIGTYVLSSGYYDAYYKRAQRVRTKLVEQFADAFSRYDFLIGPTAPTPAFKIGAKSKDPLAMYLEDVMTVAVSLVGATAVSIPYGLVDNLPVGLQIIGPQRSERRLLESAVGVEKVIGDWKAS